MWKISIPTYTLTHTLIIIIIICQLGVTQWDMAFNSGGGGGGY